MVPLEFLVSVKESLSLDSLLHRFAQVVVVHNVSHVGPLDRLDTADSLGISISLQRIDLVYFKVQQNVIVPLFLTHCHLLELDQSVDLSRNAVQTR